MRPVERTWTVRGYEVDFTRTTPLSQVLSYLEQLRWEWIAEPEWGLDEGVHDGHLFVVRRQLLELVERPRFGDALKITGAIQKVGRSQVIVRHRLSVEGQTVGQALVTAIWLGPNRRLARIPERAREVGRAQAAADGSFGTLEGPEADVQMPSGRQQSFLDAPRYRFRPRGLTLELPEPFEASPVQQVIVRPSDCDVFAHVNASKWLDYIDDARRVLGHHGVTNRVAIDYAAEALAGDTLDISARSVEPGIVHATVRRDGAVLCRAALGISDL